MEQAEQSQADLAAAGTSVFNALDGLMWEILRFLWTCPNRGEVHRYRFGAMGEVQRNIIEALVTGQYIMFRDENLEIEHFLCYWRVREEDIEPICDGFKPADITSGDKLFICEHGNKGGRKSLTLMIKEIKKVATGNKGVFWRNFNRQTFKVFLNKRGN